MTTDINQVLSMWTTAERTGDARTLDILLADEFVGIGPVGFALDKPMRVGRFEHGLRYEQLDLDELAIHRHGNTCPTRHPGLVHHRHRRRQ